MNYRVSAIEMKDALTKIRALKNKINEISEARSAIEQEYADLLLLYEDQQDYVDTLEQELIERDCAQCHKMYDNLKDERDYWKKEAVKWKKLADAAQLFKIVEDYI